MFHTTNSFLKDVMSDFFVATLYYNNTNEDSTKGIFGVCIQTRLCTFLTFPVGVAVAPCSSAYALVTVAQLVGWEGLFTVRAKSEGAV